MAIPIRDAREEDLPAVLEIYNDVMANAGVDADTAAGSTWCSCNGHWERELPG